MNMKFKEEFIQLWNKYFKATALPIVFYYTDDVGSIEVGESSSKHRCVIADLSRVRDGKSFAFNVDSVGCGGGKRYLGFSYEIMPNFEYFLSCGIPGKLKGERYKKSPEIVKKALEKMPEFRAPARFIVFKRWDMLEQSDEPDVVIFFAPPDVLSGLFTLANFDEIESIGVVAPFAAGCASIVQYPYLEKSASQPKCVLGLFDISARPYIPENILTFAVPMNKFVPMIKDMEESFLITDSWQQVKQRIR